MTGPKLSRTWGSLAGKWRALFKRQKLPFKVASLADIDTGQKCCYSFKGRYNRHLMIRYSHEIICAECSQNANIAGCRTISEILWEGGLYAGDDKVKNHTLIRTFMGSLNPYLTYGFSRHYHLGESTFFFRGVRSDF